MSDEVMVDASNLTQLEVAESSSTFIELGATLLMARKAKGFTQQDVSNTLRLSLKQIEALECNDFAALPDAMITRGFIRNYARLLGLDAEPLLASYKAQVPDKEPNALSVKSSTHQIVSSKKRQPWLLYSFFAVLLSGLVIWFLFTSYLPKSVKTVAEKTHEVTLNPVPATSEAVSLPELALPAAERQVESEQVAIGNESSGAVSTSGVEENSSAHANGASLQSTVVDSNALKANAARVASQPEQVLSAQLQTTKSLAPASSAAAMKDSPIVNSVAINPVTSVKSNSTIATLKKVNISATGRSWVSITDKSGKVIFEKMLTAGSEESFEAGVPMNVVIGNVQATKLTFSSKPVDLGIAAKSNVAHLVLE